MSIFINTQYEKKNTGASTGKAHKTETHKPSPACFQGVSTM